MKILGIDHVGIAVASLEEALSFFVGVLRLRAGEIEERPEQGLRLVYVHTSGAMLELIEAADWRRTTQKHLEWQGPGVYHIGLLVADLDAAIAELRAAGVRMIDERPREGTAMRIAYIHPGSSGRALIELVERRR